MKRAAVLFVVAFVIALALAGVTAASTRTFWSSYCNYATAQPTTYLPRDGALNYAYVATHEGYQWGGGCWNNNDVDDAYGDPVGVVQERLRRAERHALQIGRGGDGRFCERYARRHDLLPGDDRRRRHCRG